ncbi:hypothetical protein [Halobacterium zhouii]|uniref:hypothetical protein n=1 Tax=Halobacterium zhouii TaxID=2902624 RepID=UPI001E49A097|nr:hypothetical protein [Halobacterium zhouii]
MERFAELVVVGGVALVAGLWVTHLVATQSALWVAGVAAAVLGATALAAGIVTQLDWQPAT